MSSLNQKTVKKPVSFKGIGLNSGETVNINIKPSAPNSGIIFKRVDLKDNNEIFPNFLNVTNTSLNTTISKITLIPIEISLLKAFLNMKIHIMKSLAL